MSIEQSRIDTGGAAPERQSLRRYLATSPNRLPRVVRWVRRAGQRFSVPAPRMVVKPAQWLLDTWLDAWHWGVRVFICEPLFKACCKKYGRNLRTDCHLHWVRGKGDIILGDNVWLDGAISITFAARFADRPTLEIGDNTGVGQGCRFTVGKRISIGRNCNLSGDILVMDSNAHNADPRQRWALQPPALEDVRPVIIRDGVWIGLRCIIFPGVKIGEGSVVSAGSVVRNHVPPYSVVAGNPARVMFRLKKPDVEAGN